MNTQSIELKVLGQRIVLKSTGGDPETTQEVIQLVTQKVNEAEERCKSAVPHQVALLALLDLAEQYVQAKRRTLDFKHQVDTKSSQILTLLEAEMQ